MKIKSSTNLLVWKKISAEEEAAAGNADEVGLGYPGETRPEKSDLHFSQEKRRKKPQAYVACKD